MFNPKLTVLIAVFALSIGCTIANAQSGGNQKAKPGGKQDKNAKASSMEFVEQYNRRHASQDPRIGEVIKTVEVYDAQGKTFNTESLRGKYTVLVFGCLT